MKLGALMAWVDVRLLADKGMLLRLLLVSADGEQIIDTTDQLCADIHVADGALSYMIAGESNRSHVWAIQKIVDDGDQIQLIGVQPNETVATITLSPAWTPDQSAGLLSWDLEPGDKERQTLLRRATDDLLGSLR